MTVYFKQLGDYGRLGNCFFQMAATIGASKKFGDNYRFPHQPWFDNIGIAHSWSAGGPISKHIPTYNEPHFHYREIPRIGKMSMNLHGYFQSEKYFKHCKDLVRKELTPKYNFKHPGYTAIHVRRTDYLRHEGCYTELTRGNYYDKAMFILPSKYLIFSDDLGWCKEQFKGNEFDLSEERDPVKDMAHIIGCDNHIIANSSFSWWGAWLCNNEHKTVIAPDNWFGPKLSPTHNTKDLIPEGWKKV